jgi:hypothetical protein
MVPRSINCHDGPVFRGRCVAGMDRRVAMAVAAPSVPRLLLPRPTIDWNGLSVATKCKLGEMVTFEIATFEMVLPRRVVRS